MEENQVNPGGPKGIRNGQKFAKLKGKCKYKIKFQALILWKCLFCIFFAFIGHRENFVFF